ncbi:MAG: 3-oxoadipyl-CoA thiolase [Bacteroidales bacterium]|nr:3-oxoadipyl-CoA thiolase [Bacteroidales bacterium]
MKEAFLCIGLRTPIGKYGGSLSTIRADDLAAYVIKKLVEKLPQIPPSDFDEVVLGCSNQAGEDNRNVARMALLLAGLPHTVPGVTVNRLCGSGMEAIDYAVRKIKMGSAHLIIAGGVENMSRAPFVFSKTEVPFSREVKVYDTTLGWRFPNPIMEKLYGIESMAETAENLAREMNISREDQDKFALWSQEKAWSAWEAGYFNEEVIPFPLPQPKGDPILFNRDEHMRQTSLEKLAALKPVTFPHGTITAGNASGINDGAAVVLVASEEAIKKYNLTPVARYIDSAVAGVPPRIMGIGPVLATEKLFSRLRIEWKDIDLIEINEAFAAQALACIRSWKLDDQDPRINPQGGAIALGHPLGMSGTRLVLTAMLQLQRKKLTYALCTMCIGVGQGISCLIEKL